MLVLVGATLLYLLRVYANFVKAKLAPMTFEYTKDVPYRTNTVSMYVCDRC